MLLSCFVLSCGITTAESGQSFFSPSFIQVQCICVTQTKCLTHFRGFLEKKGLLEASNLKKVDGLLVFHHFESCTSQFSTPAAMSSSYNFNSGFFSWREAPHSLNHCSQSLSPSCPICSLLHVCFGLPRFRFSFTSSINALFGTPSSSLLTTCPYHLTPFAFAI